MAPFKFIDRSSDIKKKWMPPALLDLKEIGEKCTSTLIIRQRATLIEFWFSFSEESSCPIQKGWGTHTTKKGYQLAYDQAVHFVQFEEQQWLIDQEPAFQAYVIEEERKKELEKPENRTFLALLLYDPEIHHYRQQGKSCLFFFVEREAYIWLPISQHSYKRTPERSPYNKAPLVAVLIDTWFMDKLTFKPKPCPEYVFDKPLSFYHLERRTLRSGLLHFLRREKKVAKIEKRFTMKNLKLFLGVSTKVKTTDFCLSCNGILPDPATIVCTLCRDFLEDEVKTSSLSDYTRYLPKGLLRDPLEIRFESTGIKYKNRRTKYY